MQGQSADKRVVRRPRDPHSPRPFQVIEGGGSDRGSAAPSRRRTTGGATGSRSGQGNTPPDAA